MKRRAPDERRERCERLGQRGEAQHEIATNLLGFAFGSAQPTPALRLR